MAFKNVYYRGAGKVYMGTRNTDGSKNPARFVGNAPQFNVELEIETEEVKDSTEGTDLIDLRLQKMKRARLKLTLFSIHAENMALMVQGTKRSITGSSVTNEQLAASAAAGDLLKTKHENISAITVKGGVGGATTLVLDTDYKIVDAAFGQIEILTTQANPVKIDYTYASRTQVVLMDAAQVEYYIEFHGKNVANGNKKFFSEIYRFVFDPSKELPLIGEETAKFELEGEALFDSTRSSDANLGPFGRMSYVEAQLTS